MLNANGKIFSSAFFLSLKKFFLTGVATKPHLICKPSGALKFFQPPLLRRPLQRFRAPFRAVITCFANT